MDRVSPVSDSDLQALLVSFENGDASAGPRALEAVRPLVKYRLERLGARAGSAGIDTDDLIQETQAAATRHLAASSFASPRAFRAWVSKIATNKMRDQLRTRSREPRDESGAEVDFDLFPTKTHERRDLREGWQRFCRSAEETADLPRRVVVMRRGLDASWDVTSFVADKLVPATRSVYYRTRDLIPEP